VRRQIRVMRFTPDPNWQCSIAIGDWRSWRAHIQTLNAIEAMQPGKRLRSADSAAQTICNPNHRLSKYFTLASAAVPIQK
jgi:hypothetical protein